MNKRILFASLLLFPIVIFAQTKLSFRNKVSNKPCPIDTIKGIVLFQGNISTNSGYDCGYFISPCGGYQIGPFTRDCLPTFIPAYIIRNDEVVKGVRQINKFTRQKNNGKFVDLNFNEIPFESVYGLLIQN